MVGGCCTRQYLPEMLFLWSNHSYIANTTTTSILSAVLQPLAQSYSRPGSFLPQASIKEPSLDASPLGPPNDDPASPASYCLTLQSCGKSLDEPCCQNTRCLSSGFVPWDQVSFFSSHIFSLSTAPGQRIYFPLVVALIKQGLVKLLNVC